MERLKITRQIIVVLATAIFLIVGCVNPFAPALRGPGAPIWTNAQTVGELLQNFQLSYQLADSFQYAELLDQNFQFQYYDVELQRTEGWFRDTDLRSTARMFRSFHNISLIWGELAPEIESISTPDSIVEIRVQYQLILDELSPLFGFARFTLFKPSGERFRIVLWRDDF